MVEAIDCQHAMPPLTAPEKRKARLLLTTAQPLPA
jgi:hypothetical protein